VTVEVRPATPDRWTDVVKAFGRRGESSSWCWCQRFLDPEAARSSASMTPPNNRDSLHHEVTHAAVAPGLIAYVDGHPVGWARVGPRRGLPGVTTNTALARVLSGDDTGAWWLTCFVVDAGHRRSGVGMALLEAAVAFARDHGATAVEGHPVDVAGLKADRVAGSALYTGTLAMFEAAGFVEVARTSRTRPVMRRVL